MIRVTGTLVGVLVLLAGCTSGGQPTGMTCQRGGRVIRAERTSDS